jgi:hypothetical protein
MNYLKEQLLTDSILIPSSNITKTKNIEGFIEDYISNIYENKCESNSFIAKDTTQLINRSIGVIRTINKKNYIEYKVTFKFKSISPSIGDIFKTKINSVTKMGIISYLKMDDQMNIETSPIIFIIPNEYINEEKNYSINQDLKVKVLNIRSKFKGKQMQIVCEIHNEV